MPASGGGRLRAAGMLPRLLPTESCQDQLKRRALAGGGGRLPAADPVAGVVAAGIADWGVGEPVRGLEMMGAREHARSAGYLAGLIRHSRSCAP